MICDLRNQQMGSCSHAALPIAEARECVTPGVRWSALSAGLSSRAIGESAHRAIGSFEISDLRFAESANGLMFSRGTADSRSGGVCHAGGRLSALSAVLHQASPVSRHSSLVTILEVVWPCPPVLLPALLVSRHFSLVTGHCSWSGPARSARSPSGLYCFSSLVTLHSTLVTALATSARVAVQ